MEISGTPGFDLFANIAGAFPKVFAALNGIPDCGLVLLFRMFETLHVCMCVCAVDKYKRK